MSNIRFRSRGDRIFDFFNVVLMVIIMFVMIYPMYFTVIASVSEPAAVVSGDVYLKPEGFTLEAYKNAFQEKRIWVGYRNTVIYTVLGTVFNLFLTLPTAYAWSKKKLVGRNLLSAFLLISMYLSGGLMPTYLQVKALGLLNKWYTLIILGGVSIYNVVVTRVYFTSSIPDEIYESVSIDGGSDYTAFFRFALPLAKPIIAVMTLFYAVSHWESYYNGLIYVSNVDYQPLQLVLRSILLQNQNLSSTIAFDDMDAEMVEALLRQQWMAEAMKYALIFISSAPMLILYPFVQKYFVKGIMIGSLKG